MRSLAPFALAGGLLAAPALAHSAAPGFWDLERGYRQDPTLALSRAAVASAIPAGTPLADAEARLVDAGAGCRPLRRKPAITRCLIHQYSLADGAADDIRWTVSLHAPGGLVRDLAVDRYVDRHGTN